ncbi:MAG: exo-beta-N-acetylmuramidase NamZ domain-containing protein [Gammaproteobacteria bacterium]
MKIHSVIAVSFFALQSAVAAPVVKLGVDVLLESDSAYLSLVEGKRVGLITNQSGVDSALVPTVDRLARDSRVSLVRLFGPEHGIRGEVPAGEKVADDRDPQTGVRVVSLYGKDRKPSKAALEGVDILMFDIQDVGSRTYTYISTLGEAMRACAETQTPLVVLDRPNPLSGTHFEGPMIEDRFRSFIGWGPMPVTHGMTLGEAARFFNDQLKIGCTLHVVPMRGWKRSMIWDDTGLSWTITSPHIPSVTQAYLYATTGMVSATFQGVSDGVGSTMPFEVIGAEFIDASNLERTLQVLNLPGVRFQAIYYKPFYGSFKDKPLRGVRLRLTDPRAYRPIRTSIAILTTLQAMYPEKLVFKDERPVGIHWGNTELRRQLEAGLGSDAIIDSWRSGNIEFEAARQRALIYD